jgi:hypothetical protein
VRRLRLHHPRHRWLAVPWRDALSLLRAPGRSAGRWCCAAAAC